MTPTTPAATPAGSAVSTAHVFRLIDVLEAGTLRSVLRRLAFENKAGVLAEINAVIAGAKS